MSLLTAIPAAKLWCQQMASISQITFVVSEEVGSNTEQAPSHRIFSIGKNRILKSSNHGGNAEKMNGMRIDISRWGLGGCGWGGVPARQNPHWEKTIGAGRKNWRLKGGRTFVSDVCHKSGPYLPFVGKPWTSLWGAITFFSGAATVLRKVLHLPRSPWHFLQFPLVPPASWLNCQVSQNIGASAAAERRQEQQKSDRKIFEETHSFRERYLRKHNILEKDIWGNTIFWRKIFEETQSFGERYLRKGNVLEKDIWGNAIF